LRALWVWVVLAAFPLAAFGAGEGLVLGWKTGSEPLQVESKTLEAFGEGDRVVFEGDVVARQGDVTLQADRVEVQVKPDTREIRSVEARGSVRIQRGDVVASGEAASYDAQSGVVVLTGDPKVWRDKDVLAGQKITLYLAENRSVVEGARAVLYPGKPKEEKSP
jgi:lipopolysaccharide export system protein LptA